MATASATSAVLLLAWLRNMGLDIPQGSRLQRTRRSIRQRDAHEWAWQAIGPDGSKLGIGSEWRMTTLLTCKTLAVTEDDGRTHIAPTWREVQRLKKNNVLN